MFFPLAFRLPSAVSEIVESDATSGPEGTMPRPGTWRAGGFETRPTKEISCWFMCSIRLLRQDASVEVHFSLASLRARSWAGFGRALVSCSFLESRGSNAADAKDTGCLAIRFHGNNAFSDSTAHRRLCRSPWELS